MAKEKPSLQWIQIAGVAGVGGGNVGGDSVQGKQAGFAIRRS